MIPDPGVLLPEGVSLWIALGLMAASFVSSAITASMGLGGGITMLAVLGLVFPPAVLVPVHGFVQLGSNGGRAIVMRTHIHWPIVLWFALGAIPGSILGARVALALPEALFSGLIAAFVLYSTWGPQPKATARGPVATLTAGAVISGLGMIVGASGLLVAGFLKSLADRRRIVSTHAAVMTFSNIFKVTVFGVLGFAFAQYVPLVLAMIATGFMGTVVGSRFLENMPEAAFRRGFKLMMTVLALEMLRRAIWP